MSSKLVKKDRGKRFTIYIKSDVSQNLIEWINSQKEPSKSIRNVIEKYANGELVDAKLLLEKNSSYNRNHMKNYEGNIEEKSMKTNDESSYELEQKEEKTSNEKLEKDLSKNSIKRESIMESKKEIINYIKEDKIENGKSKKRKRKGNRPIFSIPNLDNNRNKKNRRK